MRKIKHIAIAVFALMISASSVFAFVQEISLQPTAYSLQPGNVSSQTDQYAYMPYGVATHSGNSQTPFQWLGGYGVYYDHTTELYLTTHRAYSSDMRKFISPDPLGIDGGVNVYAYANLNPLFFVDPLGLCNDVGGSAWYQHEALPGSTWQDLGMNASYAAQGLLRSPVDMVVGTFRGVQGVGTFLGNMSVDPAGTLQATADAIRNIPAAIGNWANDPQAIGSTVGQIGIGLGAAKVLQGMRGAGSSGRAPAIGQKVYRVWGQNPDMPDLVSQQSGAWGRSWTRVDPRTVHNYRSAAGLPNNANLGRFVSEGRLIDPSGITVRDALRIGDNAGGLDELVVPNPVRQIILDNVSGVNPSF